MAASIPQWSRHSKLLCDLKLKGEANTNSWLVQSS